MKRFFPFLFNILTSTICLSQKVDVLHYDAVLIPEIAKKTIEGSVEITLLTNDQTAITLDIGDLEINDVTSISLVDFEVSDNQLKIQIDKSSDTLKLKVEYKGAPRRGLLFNTEKDHVYTVYFTHFWMPCIKDPGDKATFDLDLILPKKYQSVASGKLIGKTPTSGKIQHSWKQNYPTSSYTYGFAIGDFDFIEEVHRDIKLSYFAQGKSKKDLLQIFDETSMMIDFFEEKSGVAYDQASYSQLLIGNHYQEMTGLSVLKEIYGDYVLKDSTETNLISHELGHQWWGNRITCESWNHFWLNEAMVTFLSAAYNEYRFGKEKYTKDINAYYEVYNKILKAGNDKPLVFPDWTNPSRDDRNIVYFKGAYVLHLLRLEVGEKFFWNGIKLYSQTYFDRSVETKDFQKAMEDASERSLDEFFDTWVYGSK